MCLPQCVYTLTVGDDAFLLAPEELLESEAPEDEVAVDDVELVVSFLSPRDMKVGVSQSPAEADLGVCVE